MRKFTCSVLMAPLGGILGIGIYNVEWFRFAMAVVCCIAVLIAATNVALGKTK